ncbi:MAG: hypothetical protein K9L30_10125 [Desulfobacterales bacterium]|nr:hypothetical protein [Desulfobacterales bacterium]
MASESALEKRIKRHVVGKVLSFFAASTPGMEQHCHDELNTLHGDIDNIQSINGGVDFTGRLSDCYTANLKLRTANRVLMRIDDFKATNFRQLEKKVTDFPWELYLEQTVIPDIHVTTHTSRLFHKDAIKNRISDGIRNHLSTFINNIETYKKSEAQQQLFIRAVNDRFFISIDASGEILHKRGVKTHGGRAPIRETLAANILKIAGYEAGKPLIDPMCGSGTFPIEGAMMVKHIPPGWFRNFAFMSWPSFQPGRWSHIRRELEKKIITDGKPTIFAFDKDETACNKLNTVIQKYQFEDVLKVKNCDFFSIKPSEITDKKGLIVINPPYGLRIGTIKERTALFFLICDRLKTFYNGWNYALIAPSPKLAQGAPFDKKVTPILHGGLKLNLLTGKLT